MIQVDNLQVTFNPGTPIATRAIASLSLTIPNGQFVTVIGSNGAGKSTLLKVLSGDVIPEQGRVLIDGQEVTTWSAPRRAGWVAQVFQDPLAGSCANLTIAENLALAYRRGQRRRLHPALTTAMQVEFRTHLSRLNLGLEHRLNDKMGLLSGGQRQAISLLMSTLANHKILLLDEHTAALDPKTAAYISTLTQQIVRERQLTTLMVTHSMHQSLAMGDRTLMLHEGRIVLDVGGADRAALDVPDLLQMFEKVRGEGIVSDRMLLG